MSCNFVKLFSQGKRLQACLTEGNYNFTPASFNGLNFRPMGIPINSLEFLRVTEGYRVHVYEGQYYNPDRTIDGRKLKSRTYSASKQMQRHQPDNGSITSPYGASSIRVEKL